MLQQLSRSFYRSATAPPLPVPQEGGAVGRVLGGPDAPPDALPHHDGAQPGLERGPVCRGPLHQGVWLGPEGRPGPHPLGRGHRQWGQLRGGRPPFRERRSPAQAVAVSPVRGMFVSALHKQRVVIDCLLDRSEKRCHVNCNRWCRIRSKLTSCENACLCVCVCAPVSVCVYVDHVMWVSVA